MGLSNNQKEVVSTYQLLLDISQHIGILASDPKALEKQILLAYSLPEKEQKKADEARANIAKNEQILESQRKSLADLDKSLAELNTKQLEIDGILKEISVKNSDLRKREDALSVAIVKLASDQTELKNGFSKLETEKAYSAEENIKNKSAVEERLKEINSYESSLKAKAEQLKVLTEGL